MKRVYTVVTFVTIIVGLVISFWVYNNYIKGSVEGHKPWYQPKLMLPKCKFSDVTNQFTNEPCYVPPGVFYD